MRTCITRRNAIAGLALVAFFGASPVLAQSVTGSYRAEGRNPDGSDYSGTVRITEQGGSIRMSWKIANQSYSGSGERKGDVIWVDWGDKYPVVYVRMPNGELHGTWSNGRGLERLIP